MNDAPFAFAQNDYPLAPSTYYKVGGPARIALLPSTPDEAEEAYAWMVAQDSPCLILGGASNVLIPDTGFPGIVLFTQGLDAVEALGNDRYRIEGGAQLDDVVRTLLLKHNYGGTGALAGIPGSVGGAIYMNAGTVNGSTCQFLESVELLSASGRREVAVSEDLHTYRGQSFCAPNDLILAGVFQFARVAENQQAIYDHYIRRRKEKQPQGNCCGSVFKNLEDRPAGALIEACGLKGERRGGAVISPMHANFIMNDDNATFDDIMALITLCKDRVREKFSVELVEEVRIIKS